MGIETMTASFVSTEQSLVKRLTPQAATLPIFDQPTPIGLSSPLGSIEKSSSIKAASSTRPRLSQPELEERTVEGLLAFIKQFADPRIELAKVQIRSDQLNDLSTQIFDVDVQADSKRLQKLNEELRAAISQHMKSMRAEKPWGILKDVLEYFTAALSLVCGAALIITGVGTAAGALLIAAGGLALVNRIMSDTGSWKVLASYFTENHEMQIRIASRLEIGMFLLSLTLSLAGGALAFQTGVIAEIATLDKAVKTLMLTSTLFNTGAQLAKASIKKKTSDMEAKIVRLSGDSTLLRNKMMKDTTNIEESQKVMQQNISLVKSAMRYLEYTQD